MCLKHDIEDKLNSAFKALESFLGRQSFINQGQIVQRNDSIHCSPPHLLCTSLSLHVSVITQGKLVVAGLTGGEMDSFIQVAEVLFLKLLPSFEEWQCWMLHINIMRLLQHDSFSNSNLMELNCMTKEWKLAMVQLYSKVLNWRKQDGQTMTRKKSMTQKQQQVTMATSKTETKQISFKFPNFKVTEHWPELIHFLGPPWFQDTKLWEFQHLEAKMTAQLMNQQNMEHTILIKVFLHPFV
jgi:hypothetical protein